MRQSGSAITQASKTLDETLRAMEPGLKQFSRDGLNDARLFMVELRNLVHMFTRIGQKIESDPRRFFFGYPVQEYHPQ
jgi:hypothetical protein